MNNFYHPHPMPIYWKQKTFIFFFFFSAFFILAFSINFLINNNKIVFLKIRNSEEFKPKYKEISKPVQDKLLVIMFDGFKSEYLTSFGELKGFNRLMKEGAMAKWMEPIFPSLSYACWTTLTTGLYAESHNVIGNSMYDISRSGPSAHFHFGNIHSTSDPHWLTTEPIWITATKSGKRVFGRRWGSCHVPFEGVRPKDCTGYSPSQKNPTFSQMLDEVIQWFDEFDMFMVYVEEIDNAGHDRGPNSQYINDIVKRNDGILKDFLVNLDSNNLSSKINILVFGDHGMIEVTNVIPLNEHIDEEDVKLGIQDGPLFQLFVKPEQLNKVSKAVKNMTGVSAFLREEIPERFYYRNSRLAPELLLLADPGNMIVHSGRKSGFTGMHGYDPQSPDMRTILLGRGPAFRPETVVEAVKMVDVYQMYGRLLKIELNPHNGTWSHIASMFN